ncbi:flavodoxin [Permianibacter sp. IMCC34836]|uniref:PepSY domain-containing protein n=1 Tax=Permianibacter fluminis TaxID=2738515 RepID=UPI0015543D6E|nr:sulfite reductase flavoprotein subunit alpha [Permianibacter fluminis]NQD38281.1 flavodoxin [Permianibacter fluminis]
MFKKLWFQTHWLLGISAGVVLALVGLTGAMLSFEQDILRLLNPAVMTVEPGAGRPLSAVELIRRAQLAAPEKTVIGLTRESDPAAAGQVGFAGGRRGEWVYQNPYTGALLGKPERGEGVLHLAEDLHRRLAAGDVGKQIVGASTVALLVLALSGLYLRWPRDKGNWRAWLKFSWARTGRSFLWDLHSVIGTWVLPLYLLAALTGLYWSYDWYRDGLFELTGAPRPTPVNQAPPANQGPPANPVQSANPPSSQHSPSPVGSAQNVLLEKANRENAERGAKSSQNSTPTETRQQPSAPTPINAEQLALLWQVFEREVPAGYRSVTLRLPERSGGAVEFRYLDREPAHQRASNTLTLDVDSLAVQKHERYDALAPGAKLMRSIFALHSGGYFGVVGLILMMLASVLMPLFAITGWLLYLDRRGKKKAARQLARGISVASTDVNASSNTAGEKSAPLLIAYASQTGYAEQLAWQTAGSLQAAGVPVQVHPLAVISSERLQAFSQALFVVSTFGDGEAPDAARAFEKRLSRDVGALNSLRYAVLALGDRQYQRFCGFGHLLEQWLQKQGAHALFAPVEVDKGDPAAIAKWQQQLQQLTGGDQQWSWQQPKTETWRLQQRRVLNHGSLGAPMFHIELVPLASDGKLDWQAGDLVDVWPQHSANRVRELLRALARDDDRELVQKLAVSEYPDAVQLQQWRALPTAEILQQLQPLQARSYSIASIPADASLQLLVRQERHADGSLGVGSGWLTEHLSVGAELELQIRRNPSFQCEDYQRPLLLIGNGSGLSSLRAHLRAAEQANSKGHWLIFGERSRQHDFYYQQEIAQWQANGTLAHVDLAFSRDQAARIHVQDVLREQAERLKSQVAAGAAIYVCGSAQGMAPAVEQVLLDVLGSDAVSQLLEQGRYRRDVY